MKTPTLDDRLAARTPPPGDRLAMRQRWEDLLFLHWEVSAEEIQKRLPEGLHVDTFGGRAYLGAVPFFMRKVRPRGLFALPGLSNFLELNVRTYVHDAKGLPGVWFFSLDANQPVAVEVARRWYHLPYQHAKMSARRDGTTVTYDCRRRGKNESAHYQYDQPEGGQEAEPGSLEFFLLERYVLFSWHAKKQRLFRGYVHHAPYRYSMTEPEKWSALPLQWEGFDPGDTPPAHAAIAAGFDVNAFAIAPVS